MQDILHFYIEFWLTYGSVRARLIAVFSCVCNLIIFWASWAGPNLHDAGPLTIATFQFSLKVGHFAAVFDENQFFWR